MFLLDTNVVSELRKVRSGRADAGVAVWSRKVRTVDLFISAITVHELEIGCLLAERRDSVQGVALRNWLDAHVLRAFENRIIPVDLAVARQSASFHVPDPCSLEDGLIAATAIVHGMTVVTRNIADFERTGAALLDPWSVPPD